MTQTDYSDRAITQRLRLASELRKLNLSLAKATPSTEGSDSSRAGISSDEPHTHQWGTQPEMFGPRHEHRLGMILRETARLRSASQVLDAAVGLGQLATRVKSQGHTVFGVDASFDAALYATRSNGTPSVVGSMTDLPFKPAAFDGVTSGETLEHLDDDVSAAREIGRVLKADGLCIATVPALQSLWTASDTYYEHRRRYSSGELARLFDQNFTIEKSRYWGFPVVLLYDTLFLLPMNMRRSKKSVDSDPALKSIARAGRSGFLKSTVRALFKIDSLFSLLPFGPGLLLVARKNAMQRHPQRSGKSLSS